MMRNHRGGNSPFPPSLIAAARLFRRLRNHEDVRRERAMKPPVPEDHLLC